MSGYTSKHTVPQDAPRIGLAVRLLDGVPAIFTDRGEYVSNQCGVTIIGEMDSVVSAVLTVNLVREK